MIIRPATAADALPLAIQRYEFRGGLTAPTEPREAFVARCSAWMSDVVESGAWRAWVAERDGVIVGQIWMHLVQKVPNPVGERERLGYISNLFVLPDARGGVGTRLLEAALEHAATQQVDRIVLWPTPASRSLYERFGFTPADYGLERLCP